jgi:GT2 family glycosyltransferase
VRKIQTEICIVVPVHNAETYITSFLTTLKKQSLKKYVLIVVNDGSNDQTVPLIQKYFPEARIVEGDGNLWWTKSIVQGINYAKIHFLFSYILLINVDLEFTEHYLKNVIESQKIAGDNSLIGSAINNIKNGEKADYGWKLNYWTTKATNYSRLKNPPNLIKVDFLSGRGMLIPAKVANEVQFNSRLFPQYFADTVFSVKAKSCGYKLYMSTKSILISHVEETGMVRFKNKRTLSSFKNYLFHFSSPGNIIKGVCAHLRIVPFPQILTFLPLYLIKILRLYFKN